MSKVDFVKKQIENLISENKELANHFENSETNFSMGIKDGIRFNIVKLEILQKQLELL